MIILSKPNKSIQSVGIILGGGSSTRTGQIDKIFYKIQGIPIIFYSIMKFNKNSSIDHTIVVVPEKKNNLVKKNIDQWNFKNITVISGGKRRQDSVFKALQEIRENKIFKDIKLVAVHDAARPFFSHELLNEGFSLAQEFESVIPVISVNDTVKLIDENEFVKETLNREAVFLVQTPQIFNFEVLLKAHLNNKKDFTDDASMVELSGNKVKIYNGEYKNSKITTLEDLRNLNVINFENKNSIYGLGIDSHKLKFGVKLKLGGVDIKYPKGLDGHSDGDVLLHSVCDAILGALGLMDLGYHFPSKDQNLKGIDSKDMLIKILKEMKEKKFQLKHLDSTIILQEPKISDYRQEIEKNLAELLCIDEFSVNIKATSTDFLGLIGKSEGIAAQSIVTLNSLEK